MWLLLDIVQEVLPKLYFQMIYIQIIFLNILVDASLLLNDDCHNIAKNVWQTPKSISDKLTTNNLTLDCLKALTVSQKKF